MLTFVDCPDHNTMSVGFGLLDVDRYELNYLGVHNLN
jgi:hypothetical protein